MRISDAESRIMAALWRRGPLMVEEIIAETAPSQGWSDATVKALIGRLLKKRALESAREAARKRRNSGVKICARARGVSARAVVATRTTSATPPPDRAR